MIALLILFSIIYATYLIWDIRDRRQEVQIHYDDEMEILEIVRQYNTEAGYWRDDI